MATIIKAKGGNKTKSPKSHDEWSKGKKIGSLFEKGLKNSSSKKCGLLLALWRHLQKKLLVERTVKGLVSEPIPVVTHETFNAIKPARS